MVIITSRGINRLYRGCYRLTTKCALLDRNVRPVERGSERPLSRATVIESALTQHLDLTRRTHHIMEYKQRENRCGDYAPAVPLDACS
jgi:hypothetical protein